jgi:hypothetical protein
MEVNAARLRRMGARYRTSSKFVRKEDLQASRKQLKNYERVKLLVDQWIDLATELSILQIKQNRT